MKTLLSLALVVVLINAVFGQEGGYGGGYGGGHGGGYGGGYGDYGGYGEKKILKPGAFKPPVIPYYKPVITYSKYPNYGDYGEGKLIPIEKLHDYHPKIDLTKFVKPYEHAHLLQKYGKPEGIVKYAPPVHIKQPAIVKTIYQHVYVKQPHIIEKIPVIHKSTEVVVKKKPPRIDINKEVPIDIKDFGKTSIIKPKIPVKEPEYEKPKVEGGGEGGYGGYGREEGRRGEEGPKSEPEYQ